MTTKIFFIILFGLIVRLVGILYIYYGDPNLVLNGTDSLSFYSNATYIARTGIYYPGWSVGWTYYVNMMGFLMSFLNESIFLMCGFSALFWFMSALLVDRTLVKLFATEKNRAWAAIIMALLPTGIFYTSIPLREPLQLFGMAAISYMLVSIVLYRQYSTIIIGVIGALLAGTSHIAMLVASLISMPMLFFYNGLAGAKRIAFGKIAFGAATIFIAIAVLYAALEAQTVDMSGGLVDVAERFQKTGATLDSRAQYKTEIEPSSGIMVFPFLVQGLFQYMLEPMPWRIASLGDVFVTAENILRVILIFIAVKAFLRENRLKKVTIFTFLMTYLAIELFWSLGTINWGTASRHHLPALPFLLIAALMSNRAFDRKSAPRTNLSIPVYG